VIGEGGLTQAGFLVVIGVGGQMFFIIVIAASLIFAWLLFTFLNWLDGQERRKRTDALLPLLKKIVAAIPAELSGPRTIAVWRRDGLEVVHLVGRDGDVDYRLTRIGTIGGPLKFHVELCGSARPVVDDIDWRCEALDVLKEIFLKHKSLFDQARAIRDGIGAAIEREEARNGGLN
jgi:hypothetical protein